jgi:hypothetical protein
LLIIGTLLVSLLLGGCGTVRLAYGNAPSLVFWWLDGYLDFETDQTTIVRAGLQRAHDWHRREELPLLLAHLTNLQARALEATTPETLCQLANDLQIRYQTTLLLMVPTVVAVAPNLREAQLEYLQRALAKRRTDWQRDNQDGTTAERMERRLQKAVDRTESFYGKLRPDQVEMLRAQVTASTFDAALQSRESLRRHQDVLTTLATIRSSSVSTEQVTAAITALLQRSYASPDANYQKYLTQLIQHSCGNLAALHNSMQPKQRADLAETLKSYAADLRSQLPAQAP